MPGLTPEVAGVVKQVVAGLIQCNPSPAVIEFFEEVVEDIDAVTLASPAPQLLPLNYFNSFLRHTTGTVNWHIGFMFQVVCFASNSKTTF